MTERKEHITIELQDPLGWIYVDEYVDGRWGWEARLGGFGIDAGICNTKDEALKKARDAVDKENNDRREK